VTYDHGFQLILTPVQEGETRKRIMILNGPNLGSLGTREPAVYGTGTLSDLVQDLVGFGARLGVDVGHTQTNDEAELISLVARVEADALILNPGALTHTSRALGDAVRSTPRPTVEVHITDPKAREPWRSVSMIEDACIATIAGRGRSGYRDAIRLLVNRWAAPYEELRYGPHPVNVGELRPGEGLVVLVHGGVWRRQYGRDSLDSLAVDLHRRGVGSWNIGYRRLGEGGGWPGSGHDVVTALDQAGRLIDRPVVVVGHSAGGYLAMWAAARTSTPVAGVFALAPIADLDLAVSDGGELAPEAAALLEAGAPARPDPGRVPTLVLHGTSDTVVPPTHSERIEGREGVTVERVDAGHYALLDPTKAPWQKIVERVREAAIG